MRHFGAREAGQTVDVVRQRRERARGLSLLPRGGRGVQGGVGVGPAPRDAAPRVLGARHAHRRGLVHPRRDPPGLREEVRQRERVPQSAGVLAAGARRVRLGRRARRRRRIVARRMPPDGDGRVPGDQCDDDERRHKKKRHSTALVLHKLLAKLEKMKLSNNKSASDYNFDVFFGFLFVC